MEFDHTSPAIDTLMPQYIWNNKNCIQVDTYILSYIQKGKQKNFKLNFSGEISYQYIYTQMKSFYQVVRKQK